MRTFTRLGIGAIVSMLLLPPLAARAQPADAEAEAAAQVLFERAVAEMDANDFANACPKLEEVTRLVPTGIGAKETLAECYEGMGRLASARAMYQLAQTLAYRAGENARADKAGEKAAALEPKLAYLTIRVPELVRRLPGLAVVRDGIVLGAGIDAPLPIDAGAHVLEVRATGYRTFKTEIRISANGVRETVVVPPLEKEPKPGESSGSGSSPAVRWQKPVGFAALGLGAAALGVSGLFAGLAVAKRDESNAGHCDAQNICDNAGLDLREQAISLGNGATATLVVGGALAAGGVALLLFAPSPAKGREGDKPAVSLAIEPFAVRMRGAF